MMVPSSLKDALSTAITFSSIIRMFLAFLLALLLAYAGDCSPYRLFAHENFARRREFFFLGVVDLGKLQIELLHRVDNRIRHRQPRIPLFIRRNHVPRRV